MAGLQHRYLRAGRFFCIVMHACPQIKWVGMVRLLMQWDIKMGREQPYFEFVMREFAPGLMQLGIEPAEVWYTIYGNGPQMLTIGEVSSLERLQAILQSDVWEDLHSKLRLYVINYKQRVVEDNNRTFQL